MNRQRAEDAIPNQDFTKSTAVLDARLGASAASHPGRRPGEVREPEKPGAPTAQYMPLSERILLCSCRRCRKAPKSIRNLSATGGVMRFAFRDKVRDEGQRRANIALT